jgi:rod shape-determining protein MreD
LILPALTIGGGLLVIVLEGVVLRLFGIAVFAPQLAVLAVVYVGLRRSFAQAALAALLFSAAADICWGGPRGYYALGLTATFLLATALRPRFRTGGPVLLAVLVVPAVVLTDVIALLTLALFHRGAAPLGALWTISPVMAFWTGVLALPLLWVMLRLDRFVEYRQTAGL